MSAAGFENESPGASAEARRFSAGALSSAVCCLIAFRGGESDLLTEHRKNPEHFPRHYIVDGQRHTLVASVTLTTVGYATRFR